jgi:hypothetical protein
MSMEICVLSNAQLDSISEWQKAIDAEGFSLQLADNEPLAQLKGFLPITLGEKQTGFECYHVDPHEMIDTYHDVQFGGEWKYAFIFVWIGDFSEMLAASMAGVAYARATEGIVFDPQAGQILTPVEASKIVQDMERNMPKLEAEMRKTEGNGQQ